MAAYNPRRSGPNVSQYIANLNAIPSPQDSNGAAQQDAYGLDDDLALFTNVEFLDNFDLGEASAGGNGAENREFHGQQKERGDGKEREGAKGMRFDEGTSWILRS